MSHEIEKEDEMFSVQKVPWHGLGKVIEGFPETSKQAMEIAELDWEVRVQELQTIVMPDQTSPTWKEGHTPFVEKVEGFHAVVRQDTLRTLGIVKTRYVPVQNREAFSFFDKVAGDKFVEFHTAGSLRNGATVWILAKLPEDLIIRKKGNGVKDDKVEEYCLLVNSHDGSQSLKALMTPIRVVCSNTLSMAVRGASHSFDVVHSGEASTKLAQGAEAIGIMQQNYKKLMPVLQKMADTPMSDNQVERYVSLVLPPTKITEEGQYGDVTGELKKAREKMLRIYQEHDTVADWRGSVWGAYNAATAWADHERWAKTPDTKLSSVWFGDSAVKKTQALAGAIRFCKIPDLIPTVGEGSNPIHRNNYVAEGIALMPF